MSPNEKRYRTKSGRTLTDADIEALADEVAVSEYAVEDVTPVEDDRRSDVGPPRSSRSDSIRSSGTP